MKITIMAHESTTSSVTRLSNENCTFTFEKLADAALLVKISGYDTGEFGTAPLDLIDSEIDQQSPIEMFIDTSQAEGVAWDVSQQWTSWFRTHQNHLSKVHILVRSKYVQQAIMVARELSRTSRLLAVYSDAERFNAMLSEHS